MKYVLAQSLAACLLLFYAGAAFAVPVITNTTVFPENPWLGDDVVVSQVCTDVNGTITSAYADITGPNVLLPRFYMQLAGDKYVANIQGSYFDRTGQFTAAVFCEDQDGSDSEQTSFTVSQLTGIINSISPSPLYNSDTIEIDFFVRKDGELISSNVTFDVSVNGVHKDLVLSPLYDTQKGWILKIYPITSIGANIIGVTARYKDKTVTASQQVDVREETVFDITSMDKTWVTPKDNITLVISASDRGETMQINGDNTEIFVGGSVAEIRSVVQRGSSYEIRIQVPEMEGGSYSLTVEVLHNGTLYTDSETLYYVKQVKGRLVDASGKTVSGQIKFIQAGSEKLSLSTDSLGYYSGYLPPGTYDIDMVFDRANVLIEDAVVNNFNNPIIYYVADVDTPGINNAGVHVLDINLSFYRVYMEMSYAGMISDEQRITLFSCRSWSAVSGSCRSTWAETNHETNAFGNIVSTTQEDGGAFVVGTRKSLNAVFDMDKKEYSLRELAKVLGVVKDETGSAVSNASVEISVYGTDTKFTRTTDANGVFSAEFLTPDFEGEYKLVLAAKSSMFTGFNATKEFRVTRTKKVSLVFPGTIQLKQGENYTQEVKIINTGQATLQNIVISISKIPVSYYEIEYSASDIEKGGETNAYIHFTIPPEAATGTTDGSINISAASASTEKTFGFTILQKETNASALVNKQDNGFRITGFASLTDAIISYGDMIILSGVACISIAAAIKLKKKKHGKSNDYTLLEIKNYLVHAEAKAATKNTEVLRQEKEKHEEIYGEQEKKQEEKTTAVPEWLYRKNKGEYNGANN